MTVSVCGLVLAAAPWLSVEGRVRAERAVEQARYAFVLGATRPFDEAYPSVVFEHRVARERAEEEALKHAFGLEPTPQVLEKEYERIEKTTKDPDQWRAIKAALGDDRSRIQQVFCRPLVVSRALRARFAFDQAIHAEPHDQARKARALFIAGKSPPKARRIKLSLDADDELPDTEALLAAAKAEAGTGPRVLTPPSPPPVDAPETVSPEVRAVLDEQLRAPGDVTTILEERDQFEVLRLVDRTQYLLTVDVVRVAKRDFESWFEAGRSRP